MCVQHSHTAILEFGGSELSRGEMCRLLPALDGIRRGNTARKDVGPITAAETVF